MAIFALQRFSKVIERELAVVEKQFGGTWSQ